MTASQALPQAILSTVERSARKVSTPVDRFHYLMGGIVTCLACSLAFLFRLQHISVINLHPVSFTLQCAIPILAVVAYCHWAGNQKLRDGCAIVLWMLVFHNLLQLPQYAAARLGMPLQDALLVRADRLLGIDGAAIVQWIHQHPAYEQFSMLSYSLMPWLVFAAVLITPLAGQVKRAKQFLLAVILSALIGACISALLPAIGPWAGYHFQPYANQAWETREIASLRSAGIFTANPDYTCGLITFPSFHVTLATLSVFALWPFRWLRFPALLAAVLIAAATVATGWHYASDVIAGAALALVAIAIAGGALARLSR